MLLCIKHLLMNKLFCIFSLFLLINFNSGFAQIPSKVTIKGIIKDAENNEAGFATVMLLNPKDSTLQNFTQSNETGAFSFSNIKNSDYLLKVSHISFLPLQVLIPASAQPVNDLGQVTIKPIAKELFEVVIREAKAPLTIRGDTIEYDASTFKAPPGSSVEDLLRRLPGIEVDASGNLKAQGKDVKRVYVDGKTFFGDDPTGATKNLDANAVSKVQVFDEKSEQSKLTGVDDGVKEKAMNLELKEEFKKGSFGKVTAAGGSNEEGVLRWAGRGSFNRFTKKSQLSFIAFANNINETGVNWEDYSEFKGQSAFSEYDNGDFGFGANTRRYFYSEDEGDLRSYFGGKGFTKNYGGGLNYNFDNKKTKFNVSYFVKSNQLEFSQQTYKETFYNSISYFNNDSQDYADKKNNHSISGRIEQNIDSNNIIIAKANFRYSYSNSENLKNSLYYISEDQTINNLYTNNGNDKNSWKLTSAIIYRHKFKKKGRSFAVSGGFNKNSADNEDNLNSINKYYLPTFSDYLHRLANKLNSQQQIKSSLLYTEPLSKKFFLEVFYNFSSSNYNVNNQVKDILNDSIRIDSLSVYYRNTVLYHRLGTDIRYSSNGLNIMLGLAYTNLKMKGKRSLDVGMPLTSTPINLNFSGLSPHLSINYEFPNNKYLEFEYSYSETEPSFENLQPVLNISNPLYRIEGNMDLKPEKTHRANLHFNYYNPASFSHMGFYINYEFCNNKITYNQSASQIDSVGIVTVSRPDNNKGIDAHDISSWLWIGYPIVKTKLTNDWGIGFNYSANGLYVNNVLNKSNNFDYRLNTSFQLILTQKLILSLYGDASLTDLRLHEQKSKNQLAQNYTGGFSVKWQFAKKSFLESNFDYEFHKNSLYDYDKSLPIFNASVRQLIGKKNRFEIRLAAFDILNKRQYIYQYAWQNYYQRTTAETLARYFMLSFSYNIKGFESKIKKNQWW